MARVSIPRVSPRTGRQRRKDRSVEDRPVLQLPVHCPEWVEPLEDRQPRQERGTTVVDFYL